MADEFTIKHACMDAQEKAIKALRFKEMIDEKGRYPKSAAIQLKNDVLRELSQTSSSINSGVDKTTGIAALLSKGDNKIKDMTTVTRNDPIKLMNSFNKKVRGMTKEKTADGLSRECRRHVADMSACRVDVGEFASTSQSRRHCRVKCVSAKVCTPYVRLVRTSK